MWRRKIDISEFFCEKSLIKNLDEKFKTLDAKFKNLDAKLNSKIDSINRDYTNDEDKIKNLQDRYKIGLNEHRAEMLKQLIQKRNEQLEQINEFIRNNEMNIAGLNALSSSIKSSYYGFARGLASVFESILFRSKFENAFSLSKQIKYSNFLKNIEEIKMDKVNQFFEELSMIFVYAYGWDLHVLSSNKIFMYANGYMIIINKEGDVVHFKEVKKINNRSYPFSKFYVNATNIISCFHDTLEIYNFKLELIYSFKPDYVGFDNLCLYDYEIAFDNCNNSKITFYNYKTVRLSKKEVCFDNISKLIESFVITSWYNNTYYSLRLIYFNDKFLFISKNFNNESPSVLFLINRDDNNTIFKSISTGIVFDPERSRHWFVNGKELCTRQNYRSLKCYTWFTIFSCDNNLNNIDTEAFFSDDKDYEDIYLKSNNRFVYSHFILKDFKFNRNYLKYYVY